MPPVALASAAFVVAFHVEPHPRALRVKPRAPCAPLVPHAAGRGSSMLACRLTAGKQTRAADDLSSVSAAARMLGEGSARDRSSRRDPFVRELRTSHDGPASSTNPSKSTRSDSRPARDRLESRIAESQRPPPRRSIEVQRATPGQAHAGGPPGPVLLLRAPHRFARGGDGPGADLWREQPQARALDEESGTALVRDLGTVTHTPETGTPPSTRGPAHLSAVMICRLGARPARHQRRLLRRPRQGVQPWRPGPPGGP